jgi:hypothetical protein
MDAPTGYIRFQDKIKRKTKRKEGETKKRKQNKPQRRHKDKTVQGKIRQG